MNEIEKTSNTMYGIKDDTAKKVMNIVKNGLTDGIAEKVIILFANVALALGVILSLGFGIELLSHKYTTGVGIVVLFGGILGSVITWAMLMVVANISNNIRKIRDELRKQKEDN